MVFHGCTERGVPSTVAARGCAGAGGGGDSVLFAYWVSEGRQFGSQQFIVFIFALVLIDMAAHWT
jgi:hypothetical protein